MGIPVENFTRRAAKSVARPPVRPRAADPAALLRAAYMGDPQANEAIKPFLKDTRFGADFSQNMTTDLHDMVNPKVYAAFARAMVNDPRSTTKRMIEGTVDQYKELGTHPIRAMHDHPIFTPLSLVPVAKTAMAAREGSMGLLAAQLRDDRAMGALQEHRAFAGQLNQGIPRDWTTPHSRRVDPVHQPVEMDPKAADYLRAITDFQANDEHFGGRRLTAQDNQDLSPWLQLYHSSGIPPTDGPLEVGRHDLADTYWKLLHLNGSQVGPSQIQEIIKKMGVYHPHRHG